MNVQLAKSLFDKRAHFPKVRGAPTFTEPTWDSIGEEGQRPFLEFADSLTK